MENENKKKRKRFNYLLLVVLVLTVLGIFFLPIPYYLKGERVNCLLIEDCPRGGWNLGPSLYTKIKSRFSYDLSGDEVIKGKFCGGIAANLPENQCPPGYSCVLDEKYPDAGGKCVKR